MATIDPRTLPRWAAALVIGAAVAAVGTSAHRAYSPWGAAAALALVLASSVLVRAWAGLGALVAYGAAWVAVVQVLSLNGPGGDVLIPAGQRVGYVWIIGGMVMIAVGAFAPRRWFSDTPRVRVAATDGAGDPDA